MPDAPEIVMAKSRGRSERHRSVWPRDVALIAASVVGAGSVFFDGLAFGIPAADLGDILNQRGGYLFDSAPPQNGVTFLASPYHLDPGAKVTGQEHASGEAWE